VCCWIDWLLMIKNYLIESGPPCSEEKANMNGMHNSTKSLKERGLRTVFNDGLLCTPRFVLDFSRAWNFLTKLITSLLKKDLVHSHLRIVHFCVDIWFSTLDNDTA
jgi:hypothetical protein